MMRIEFKPEDRPAGHPVSGPCSSRQDVSAEGGWGGGPCLTVAGWASQRAPGLSHISLGANNCHQSLGDKPTSEFPTDL